MLGSLICLTAILNSTLARLRSIIWPHSSGWFTTAFVGSLYSAVLVDVPGQLIVNRQRVLPIAFRVMPIIWIAMAITAPICFIPATLLYTIRRWSNANRDEESEGIFDNAALSTFIRIHELGRGFTGNPFGERRALGGRLRKEASKIMRAALGMQEKNVGDVLISWSKVEKVRMINRVSNVVKIRFGALITAQLLNDIKRWGHGPIVVVDSISNAFTGKVYERVMGVLPIKVS